MPGRIGIIGKGNVGSALERGLTQGGYEVRTTGKDPKEVREVGAWGETLVLAVPYGERRNAIQALGDAARGKVVVDVTNALGKDMSFAASPQLSGAEEVQGWLQGAHVVKAFNTMFAQHMDKAEVAGTPVTLFVAGDDAGAKGKVLEMGRGIGFDPVDAGPLAAARYLEALGYLNIHLAYKQGLGAESGFHYFHTEASHEGAQREAGPRPSRQATAAHAERARPTAQGARQSGT